MKKTQKLFTKLAITFGVAFAACMATIPTQMSKYYEENQQTEYLNAKKYASYDDEEYEITLTENDLNTYRFTNLAEYLEFEVEIAYLQNTYIYYNQHEYVYEDYDRTVLAYSKNYDDDTHYITFDTENSLSDSYGRFLNDYIVEDFDYDITLNLNSNIYADIKQAIELDIQANQPQQHTIAGDIIASITSGLGMIGILAGEFLTGFSTLFWTGSELTPFALFSLVFLGISITFAVISLVLNVLRSNTGV